jgi:hypothetical protein
LGKLSLVEPALFWLDGHYSGGVTARGESDTPIYAELVHVLGSSHKNVIVIDDARCFGSGAKYPTIEALTAFVRRPIKVENDAIILEPS